MRRLLYLTALIGCLVFYWAYREWLSFLLLMAVVFLPWLSLLLSLPAMLFCRVTVECPSRVTVGEPVAAVCKGSSALPLLAVKSKLQLHNCLTGQHWRWWNGKTLPTDHCGALTVQPVRVAIYDYLGLFRLPQRKHEKFTLLISPKPIPVEPMPDMTRYLAGAYRPKPGGGFSEHHELRLYRPGDSLRQVHWKLSAKTGKLIFREAMEPLRGRALLTAELKGSPKELDRRLGQLLYMSRQLCLKEIPHEIRCLTGAGVKKFPVANLEQAQAAVDALLGCPAASQDSIWDTGTAAWHFHIGGGNGD